MVGLQATVIKDRLKSKLNGIVNYETWVPSAKLRRRRRCSLRNTRNARRGIDPLGYYLGGWGYSHLQGAGGSN